MKKLLLFATFVIIVSIGFCQVIPDSLKGVYSGLFYYKTSNDTNWSSISSATMYIYTIDTSNCEIYYNFTNNPPGYSALYYTTYSFCLNPTGTHEFYDLDSLKMIEDNIAQPPPITYTVTEHFYGKQIPGTSETVGIKKVNIDNVINVFPNPIENNVYINVQNTEIAEINIYTITGQVLYSRKANIETTVNLSFLEKGVYFMELKTCTGLIYKKIIKE
jgi:hypothetical protein